LFSNKHVQKFGKTSKPLRGPTVEPKTEVMIGDVTVKRLPGTLLQEREPMSSKQERDAPPWLDGILSTAP
jgi:hypothetical protein